MSAPGAVGPETPESPPKPASLVVVNPSGNRLRLPLHPIPFLVGRQADNHLILRDSRASRSHARIVVEDGSYVVEDLNSRHGLWVNGERVHRHVLRNMDRIEFGVQNSYRVTFAYEEGEINRLLEQIQSTSRDSAAAASTLTKLRALVEVARALQNSLSTQEVLTAVVDAALAVTTCERGFLLLRREEELDVAVARDSKGMPLAEADLRVPRAVIQRALHQRRELLSMSFDPLEEQGARPGTTVAGLELRSVVCVPLVRIRTSNLEETNISTAMSETVGVLYMDSRENAADLSAGNRELLQTLALEASTILENARLLEQERARQRMEDELRIAREIQQGLLPTALPTTGWFRAAASSVPSAQVGGDYYDVRQISPDAWAVVVADVSGKGVSSALLASLLQGAFLMASENPNDVEGLLAHVNSFLLDRTRGEKYATVFCGTLTSSGLLTWANAGHCAPFLVEPDGRLRTLQTTGMPVGMLEGATFQTMRTQLSPGDKILIYSDGLTEAENADGEFFDTVRLRQALRSNAALGCVELHAALIEAVESFTEGGVVRDDITAVVIEYAPRPIQP